MIPPTTDLKLMVQAGNQVDFVKYFDGSLWYRVVYIKDQTAGNEFEFPVPVSDIGNATFWAHDKAMLFMRYIRKHLHALNEAKNTQENQG